MMAQITDCNVDEVKIGMSEGSNEKFVSNSEKFKAKDIPV